MCKLVVRNVCGGRGLIADLEIAELDASSLNNFNLVFLNSELVIAELAIWGLGNSCF